MTSEGGETSPSLSLVVLSAEFDKVHYAVAMASAAAALGREARLFFTMGALHALRKPDARGKPGWYGMRAGDGRPAAEVDAAYKRAGIGDFETLLAACSELGVGLMVCEMGLTAFALARSELRAELGIEEGGLATLLMRANDGQIVFV